MARRSEKAAGIAYPQLTKDQIGALIKAEMTCIRDRDLGPDLQLHKETVAYLINFYTRRWGLPPTLTVANGTGGG